MKLFEETASDVLGTAESVGVLLCVAEPVELFVALPGQSVYVKVLAIWCAVLSN